MGLIRWLRPHPGHALFAVLAQMLALILGALPFQQLAVLIVCREMTPFEAVDAPIAHNMTNSITANTFRSANRFDGIDYDTCAKRSDVSRVAAKWMLAFNLAQELPALVVLVFAGYFVDAFGRRRAMLLLTSALVLVSTAHLAAAVWEVPLAVFVIVNACIGLCGGIPVFIMASSAYIADTCDPALRTRFFSFQEGSLALALMIGPFLGGYLTSQFGFFTVFGLQLALALLLLFHLIVIFPDSHKPAAQAVATATAPPKKTLSTVFLESIESSTFTLRAVLAFRSALGLIIIVTLQSFTNAGLGIMFLLYPGRRFGWDSLAIGQFIFASSLQKIACLALLLPALLHLLQHRLGVPKLMTEIWAARVGLMAGACAELWYATSAKEASFLQGTTLTAVAACALPPIKSLLSTLVPSTHQGRLFGSIRLFESVMQILATVILNAIYRGTVETRPEAVFYVVSGVLFCAFGVSLVLISRRGVEEMEMGGWRTEDEAVVVRGGEDLLGSEDALETATEATPLLS
ncbi:major facilitator superfamily domain-containing protein [Chytriomyces sp. MP71]|nr:major facilitator superfamily domain-containing protein [Chytriomyces sp. MP71]